MNIFRKTKSVIDANDSSLVMYSLGGDRDAFCQIVTRYQNLLCSLAYSSVGDVKHSEDIAQEVFVEAWKKLDTLNDPEKLKAWLCGILRFKVSHYRRKEDKQPVKGAEDIDETSYLEPESKEMEQEVIQKQQNDLIWKVLDEIDNKYREPLVLFYREQQSIERVAEELDLSKETVKQRLFRGRKLLKSAMSSLVEEGLKNSAPGTAFTAIVMTAISSIAPPAKAAVLGAGAAKTGSVFQLTTLITFLAACSGLISSYFGLRASLDQSRTERERRLVIKSVTLFISIAVAFVAGMFALKYAAIGNSDNAAIYTVISQVVVIAFTLSYMVLVKKMFAATRELRAQERIFEPEAFQREVDNPNSKKRDYISNLTLFGIPLVHIQFGTPEKDEKPAFGWVAGGATAHGLLIAWGGVAIAPISVGIVSVGVVTIGAVGFGFLSLGTVAIGFIAFGASAVGFKAYSSLSSLGWESALSGAFSIAKEGAIGAIAYAEQVNNEAAKEISDLSLFEQSFQWLLLAIAVFVIVPSIWHSRNVRKRMK